MNFEIISAHPMQNELVTDPVPLRIKRNTAHIFVAASMQFIWKAVEGIADAKIEIFASIDENSESLGRSINIECTDNTQDAEMFIINPMFDFIRIKYTPNSVTAGELSCFINYQEVL